MTSQCKTVKWFRVSARHSTVAFLKLCIFKTHSEEKKICTKIHRNVQIRLLGGLVSPNKYGFAFFIILSANLEKQLLSGVVLKLKCNILKLPRLGSTPCLSPPTSITSKIPTGFLLFPISTVSPHVCYGVKKCIVTCHSSLLLRFSRADGLLAGVLLAARAIG